MNYDVSSKFELNVISGTGQDVNDMKEISTFALKNKCPAIVVRPEYVATTIAARSTLKTIRPYAIITKIDDVRSFGVDKFKKMPRDAFGADGFDISFSQGRSEKELGNEIRTIRQFLEGLNSVVEVRFTIDERYHDIEYVRRCAAAVRNNPVAMIRMGPLVDHVYITTGSVEAFKEIARIRMKFSGNVSMQTIASMPTMHRFDVSLLQAKTTLRELELAREDVEYFKKNLALALSTKEKNIEEKK